MVKVKMRKRAQRKSKTYSEEPKHVSTRKTVIEKPKSTIPKLKKNWWIGVALIGIFLLVLLFNSYFNIISGVAYNPDGDGLEKYYLSGPDPYYNMRIVEETYNEGTYQFYSENDPLLDYPIGRSGGRAPLFNMMALGFSRVLTPFMDEIDAIGYAMQFIPALFGALLVFPVYSIGKDVFNKKVGLISALWLSLTVAIVGTGHGSAYSLFDHDSFNLLLFFITFAFLIKSIKEKDRAKSFFYALLGGISLAGLSMVWVEHEYLYTVIALYAFVQIFIDLLKGKDDIKTFMPPLVILFTGYMVSLPVIASKWASGFRATIPFYMILGVLIFGLIYYVLGRRKIPWTLSLPVILILGGAGFSFLWFIPELSSVVPYIGQLSKFSEIIRGTGGIYSNKVSLTIAEANTFPISNTVMNFGAVLYWLGWAGFIFVIYKFYKNHERNDLLFLVILFMVNVWLTGIAGRFLTDMAPVIAIFAGFLTWLIIDKIDYPGMVRDIKNAGGGLHGIRRGVKVLHVVGILFVSMSLIFNIIPVFTAAIPNAETEDGDGTWKEMFWGEEVSHPFGLGVGKERYWTEAFQWLKQQDTDISDPVDRPAVISWWDYGFYEVAIGEHPTVADNFQDGIPPASNFHTATSEKEAIAVLAIRLMEGDVSKNKNKVSDDVYDVLNKYFPDNAEKISSWLEQPTESPSYGEDIYPEYHQYIQNIDERFLKVGAQWPENAYYHDIVDLVNNNTTGLSLDETVWFYHDIQETTGLSIRYYATEIYDRQIFSIFAFLADKSLIMTQQVPSDEFVKINYKGEVLNPQGEPERRFDQYAKEILELPENERQYYQVTDTSQDYQDPYFNTMFYKTFFGYRQSQMSQMQGQQQSQFPNFQLPCQGMKHFYAEYVSDISKYQGFAPVVIAKYYEGATVNGSLVYQGEYMNKPVMMLVQKNLSYTDEVVIPVTHDQINISDGNFSALTGGGEIKLSVIRYPEYMSQLFNIYPTIGSGIPASIENENVGGFILKNITVQVSEDEAMRLTDDKGRIDLGNITIKPAGVEGYVFENKDDNSSFDSSSDKVLSNVSVNLIEITKIDQNGQPDTAGGDRGDNTSSESGFYGVSDLFPGRYQLYASEGDFNIYGNLVNLHSGTKTLNISKAKPANVEGKLFYDENQNGKYDSGEELKDVTVRLLHKKTTDMFTVASEIKNDTTDSEGDFSFKNLIPGSINGLNLNNYTLKVETTEYAAEEYIFPQENETLTYNISVGLAPVEVSGSVEYDGEDVEDKEIQIEFSPDLSVEDPVNNTAVAKTAITNLNGEYTNELNGETDEKFDLIPGVYNISISHKEGDVLVYTYNESGFTIDKSETEINDKDIELTEKHSATITGYIVDKSSNVIEKSGIALDFEIDESIENNSALKPFNPTTDSDGYYLVELTPEGYYNISVNYTEGDVVVYTGSGDIDSASDGTSQNISLTKESLTFTGNVEFNNQPVDDIEIDFSIDKSAEDNPAKSPDDPTSDENGEFTVELNNDASYNITIRSYTEEGKALVYSYDGQIDTASTSSLDISLTKHTVNVSGETKDKINGSNIGNIKIDFDKNESVVNNTAASKTITSDKNGQYYLELKPGSYNVSINQTVKFGNDTVNYTYIGTLEVVSEDNEPMTQTENILMSRDED